METLTKAVIELEKFMYSPWFVITLLGTGVLYTLRTRFIQFRKLGTSWKQIYRGALKKDDTSQKKGDITPFQALSTALAATVGLGNIAGVATALVLGGPGALFWMWMTALFGMATIYGEASLAIHFRITASNGSIAGGPMYYISRGLKKVGLGKFLAALFAINGSIACLLGTGNMMQSNSIALIFNDSFKIPFWLSGFLIAFLTGMVTIGGIKRIGLVAEKLVPFMIFLYCGTSIIILLVNISQLPAILWLVVKSAFTPVAAAGGFAGASVIAAMQFGVSRGILSNEAGLGSSPIAHSAAKEENPERQGILAMNGVFIDTIIVCSMTGLVILATGMLPSGRTSTSLTASAFARIIPYGELVVALSALLFGFTTLLGWSYYGEQCAQYLLGIRIVTFYRYLFVILVFLGAVIKLDLVWSIGTTANALMALPNLVGLIILSGFVGAIARKGS